MFARDFLRERFTRISTERNSSIDGAVSVALAYLAFTEYRDDVALESKTVSEKQNIDFPLAFFMVVHKTLPHTLSAVW